MLQVRDLANVDEVEGAEVNRYIDRVVPSGSSVSRRRVHGCFPKTIGP